MKTHNFLLISIFLVITLILLTFSHAATFDVENKCAYTVWAAAVPGGGQRLDTGQTWTLNVASNTIGHIWARTNCSFDPNGHGSCQTGDCNGTLQCTGGYGAPPNTLVEYALNQFNNLDIFDISLVNGFNVPVEFSPTSNNCNRSTRCTGDINQECPDALRAPGGCNHPCTVFKTNEYCCFTGPPCAPTDYSRFFKSRCPEAFFNPTADDQASTLNCPTGTNYRVVFCP